MQIYLQAPHELIQATIMLPTPKFGDTQNPEPEIDIRNAQSGKLYSYVKANQRLTLFYDFILEQEKAIELREFVKIYSAENIRLTDWRERVYLVKLINVPLTFQTIGRGVNITLTEPPYEGVISKQERLSVRLQFEGTRLV